MAVLFERPWTRTMKTTISTAVAMIETKPSTMPAMAMPRPFSPVCRIWLIAIKPRTIAGIPERSPTRIWPIPQHRDYPRHDSAFVVAR